MKPRSLLLGLSSVVLLAFAIGFVAPWCVGTALHRNIVKHFHRLEKIYPQYQFSLKDYQKGIYHSNARIEIASKSQFKNQPKILAVLEETIEHGPIIIDSFDHTLHFKLAQIDSEIQLKETPFVKFEQDSFELTAFVNYLWKLDFFAHVDEIGGQIFVSDKTPYHFALEDLYLQGEAALNHIKIKQDFAAHKIHVARNNSDAITISNILVHNELDSTRSILDHSKDNISCETVEIKHKNNTIYLNEPNLKLATQTESKTDFFELNGNVELNQFLFNDLSYGPFNAQFVLNHIPKDFIDSAEKLESLLESENFVELRRLVLKQLQGENIGLTLKDISLHVPGGLVSLKGALTLHVNDISAAKDTLVNANFTPRNIAHLNGKLLASAPKQTVIRLFKQETIDPLVNSGFLLETDNTFDLYCIFKNNVTFINGSNTADSLFNKSFSLFKRPLSKEQRFLLSLLEEDNATLSSIIQERISLNKPIAQGKYAIHIASHMGNLPAVKLLLEANVPVDITDESGNTALYWASRGGHTDLVRLLIAKKAAINVKNQNGWTPLQEAAENGHPDAVSLLLDKGARINDQDNEGRTALFWAAKEGHTPVIELLLQKGANASIKNIRSLAPLDIAKIYGRESAVSVLEKENSN